MATPFGISKCGPRLHRHKRKSNRRDSAWNKQTNACCTKRSRFELRNPHPPRRRCRRQPRRGNRVVKIRRTFSGRRQARRRGERSSSERVSPGMWPPLQGPMNESRFNRRPFRLDLHPTRLSASRKPHCRDDSLCGYGNGKRQDGAGDLGITGSGVTRKPVWNDPPAVSAGFPRNPAV